jgi:hypothetical protein
MQQSYIFKGILNTHNTSVQNYARTCAELMRNSTRFKLRHTCKMLYWLEHPTVELVYPIVISELAQGQLGVHPGQSRFLAAVLLNRTWPAVVCTAHKHTDVVVQAHTVNKLPRYTADRKFGRDCEQVYMSRAIELEQVYSNLTSLEFYTRVLNSLP